MGLRLKWFATAKAAAGCILVLVVTSLLGRSSVEEATAAAATRRVETVARSVAAALPGKSDAERHALLAAAARLPGIELALVDHHGVPEPGAELGDMVPERMRRWLVLERGIEDGGDAPAPATASAQATGADDHPASNGSARRVAGDGWAFAAVKLPAALANRRLVVATTMAIVPASVRRFEWVLQMAILIVILDALVAFGVVRNVADSVTDLTHRVRDLVVGPFGRWRDVPILSLDEVGGLARAVNRLGAHRFREEDRYREARARLDQADREKQEFLATVSHELRTPLNSILGFSQLLLGGLDGELTSGQHEDIQIIEQSGHHLLAIINDILDLSSIESGRIDLALAPTQVEALIRDVVRAAEVETHGKPVVVRVDVTPLLPPVLADPRRLRQILTNLVANSIKFTKHGEVVVRARALEDAPLVEVEVADTGPGIPSSQLQMVFESYAQIGEHRMRRRGTGLGLAICKRLVHLHGGEIRAESDLGRGASFFFTLPRTGA